MSPSYRFAAADSKDLQDVSKLGKLEGFGLGLWSETIDRFCRSADSAGPKTNLHLPLRKYCCASPTTTIHETPWWRVVDVADTPRSLHKMSNMWENYIQTYHTSMYIYIYLDHRSVLGNQIENGLMPSDPSRASPGWKAAFSCETVLTAKAHSHMGNKFQRFSTHESFKTWIGFNFINLHNTSLPKRWLRWCNQGAWYF